MQEPVNFSHTTVYSTPQELAMRLLNNLQAYSCSPNSGPPSLNFDSKASSHPREGSATDVSGERPPNLSNHWGTFPPNAFLAAAAAAAFSIKSATYNTTSCLCEAVSLKTDIHPFIEKAISEHALLSLPRNPASSKLTASTDSSVKQEVDLDPRLQPQLTKRYSRIGERGHRSRVVIHQFGDAEDHFSKALRNLHVKSAGEYELLDGSSTTHKRVWKLTSTFDGDGGNLDTSLSNSYYEAQNIADLAVERHFEKSLATFHAKQAAAASAIATNIAVTPGESASKSSLNLSLSRTQSPLSPSSSSSSSSSNSSSDGSALLSPREDTSGGPSFNPKKKWLAQYGDDEGARTIEDGGNSGVWSSNDSSWNAPSISVSTNIEKRSKSCPLLLNESAHSLKVPPNCKLKCILSSNNSIKLMELSHAAVAQSSVSPHQLPLRGFSALARAISLEVPSLRNSIEFFDDEDEVVVASKSISAQESPVSSPIAASSGFFTDSTYSLDSSNLPVISEASYFSSNASVSSSFKARHMAVLRENATIVRQRVHGYFGCESEEAVEANMITSQGQIRKRTASDASDFSNLKRSRSVVDAECGEHS